MLMFVLSKNEMSNLYKALNTLRKLNTPGSVYAIMDADDDVTITVVQPSDGSTNKVAISGIGMSVSRVICDYADGSVCLQDLIDFIDELI